MQLLNKLAYGKSLRQIATAHGKSISGLKAAITAAVRARLDKAKAAKLITSTQEQQLLGRLSARLEELINRAGFDPRPSFGHRFYRHMGGPAGDLPVPPPLGGATATPVPPASPPPPGVPY